MLYFLTVNYNSTDLIRCLKQSIQSGIQQTYQIIVINNSVQDQQVQTLVDKHTSIIEAGENLGFGRACNLGLIHIWKQESDSLVWLINPDAQIDQGADTYIEFCLAENPSIAVLGTQIRDSQGHPWFMAGKFNPWTGYLNHTLTTPDSIPDNAKIFDSPWVSGCSMIINLKQFKDCPQFDPHYFLYAEDADFCLRYSADHYQIAVTNKILVTHQVSSIIGRDKSFMYEHYIFSRLVLLKRHATFMGLLLYGILNSFKIFVSIFYIPAVATGRWRGMIRFLGQSNYSDYSSLPGYDN